MLNPTVDVLLTANRKDTFLSHKNYSAVNCKLSFHFETRTSSAQYSGEESQILDSDSIFDFIETHTSMPELGNCLTEENVDNPKQISKMYWTDTSSAVIKNLDLSKDRITKDISRTGNMSNLEDPKGHVIISDLKANSREDYTTAVNLTSQVINAASQVLQCNSFDTQHINSLEKTNKYKKFDLFSRLKEIYNACSCNVCECIPGKNSMSPNDKCKCMQSSDKNNTGNVCHDAENISLGYKKPDCFKCGESATKSCDCEPCHCVKCYNTALSEELEKQVVVVASVEETIKSNNCVCEPCECVNCTKNFQRMSTPGTHDTSKKQINVSNCRCEHYPNETSQMSSDNGTNCYCENERSRRKTITKNVHEYDFRNTLTVGDMSLEVSNPKSKSSFDVKSNNFLSNDLNDKTKVPVMPITYPNPLLCTADAQDSYQYLSCNSSISSQDKLLSDTHSSKLLRDCRSKTHSCTTCINYSQDEKCTSKTLKARVTFMKSVSSNSVQDTEKYNSETRPIKDYQNDNDTTIYLFDTLIPLNKVDSLEHSVVKDNFSLNNHDTKHCTCITKLKVKDSPKSYYNKCEESNLALLKKNDSTEDNSTFNNTLNRVKNTLKDAKAFTNYLTKLLEATEKNNRDYSSIVNKIKYDRNVMYNVSRRGFTQAS